MFGKSITPWGDNRSESYQVDIAFRRKTTTLKQYYSHGRGLVTEEDWDGEWVVGLSDQDAMPLAWF